MQHSQDRRPARTGRLPRRGTDRIEDAAAWLLTIAALLGLMVAGYVALGIHAATLEQGRIAQGERAHVEAVLLDDAPVQYREADFDGVAQRSVRFTDPAGLDRTAAIPLPGRPPAGDVVGLWVDRAGRVVSAPFTSLDAVVLGGLAGLAAAVVGAAVLAATWMVLRRVLDARNCAAWGREWASVGPLWSGR
jgi:hypothetical protein